jgi:hypothetical protein
MDAGEMTPILVRDMLMNMLLGLTALVVLVLAQINPPADAAKTVPPPGNLAISIAWPAGNTDVDLWVTGPRQDKATGYSNSAGPLFALLRDDLGLVNDASPINAENAFARQTPPGEYIVNLHGFRLLQGPVTVHVEIALGKTDDTMHTLLVADVVVKPMQEITVIRFTLDGSGNVVPGSENHVFKALRAQGTPV